MGSKAAIVEAGAATVANCEKALPPSVHRDSLALLVGYVTYAGDPTNNLTPQFIGQRCLDTANSAWYMSHGVVAADWKKLTP